MLVKFLLVLAKLGHMKIFSLNFLIINHLYSIFQINFLSCILWYVILLFVAINFMNKVLQVILLWGVLCVVWFHGVLPVVCNVLNYSGSFHVVMMC